MVTADAGTAHGVGTYGTVSVATLRDYVHRALRQAILMGRLLAKDRFNERMFAEQLGFSTPQVKEPLRQLEALRTHYNNGVDVTVGKKSVEMTGTIVGSGRFAVVAALTPAERNLLEVVTKCA